MKIVLAVLLLIGFSASALARDEADTPLTESEFIDRIPSSSKAEIIARFGEPARIIDITDDETGEVIGSIWHYHYLNISTNGDYYKTTELDFVGDHVATVVFSMMEYAETDTPSESEPESELR
ncbi:MAG: hypothetical protein LBE24_02935 [Methylobacillus sp.]|jgi:hypothetical protein|nr:hypothetical protein [Methylobacillus sp.]